MGKSRLRGSRGRFRAPSMCGADRAPRFAERRARGITDQHAGRAGRRADNSARYGRSQARPRTTSRRRWSARSPVARTCSICTCTRSATAPGARSIVVERTGWHFRRIEVSTSRTRPPHRRRSATPRRCFRGSVRGSSTGARKSLTWASPGCPATAPGRACALVRDGHVLRRSAGRKANAGGARALEARPMLRGLES